MLVPETSMNKYDGLVFPEYQIRLSRQARLIQSVTETPSEQGKSDLFFRGGVFSFYTRHHPATSCRIDYIHHGREPVLSTPVPLPRQQGRSTDKPASLRRAQHAMAEMIDLFPLQGK